MWTRRLGRGGPDLCTRLPLPAQESLCEPRGLERGWEAGQAPGLQMEKWGRSVWSKDSQAVNDPTPQDPQAPTLGLTSHMAFLPVETPCLTRNKKIIQKL